MSFNPIHTVSGHLREVDMETSFDPELLEYANDSGDDYVELEGLDAWLETDGLTLIEEPYVTDGGTFCQRTEFPSKYDCYQFGPAFTEHKLEGDNLVDIDWFDY